MAQSAREPSDEFAIPEFLRRQPERTARLIPPDWQPSQSARAALTEARPDLDDATIERRHGEFLTWCASKAVTSHNFDASWYSFMVKTHAQRSSDGPRSSGIDTTLQALAEWGREGSG